MTRSVTRALKGKLTNIVSPAGLNLSTAASRARGSGNLAADVYFRRRICERKPESVGSWVQYGHALKEAGFHKLARNAYETALKLQPDDAEIIMQLGHLAKVQGVLDEARTAFEKAKALGHPNQHSLDFELGLLRRAATPAIFADAPRTADRSGVKVFLSVPGGQVQENDKATVGSGIGVADYSYSFAMRGFVQALAELEIDYAVIEHPEYISDIRDRSGADINIHLCFYPPERIRLLKGAYNVNCFAWEFDRLRSPTELLSYHAFADQATMLNTADEIWTPADSATAAVVASGVTRPVKTVTAPILENISKKARTSLGQWSESDRLCAHLKEVVWQPLAIVPRIQPAMNGASNARRTGLRNILRMTDGPTPPRVFLTIFNVHDFRKQLRPMLEAFNEFSSTNPDAILLLKMTTPMKGAPVNSLILGEQINNPGFLAPPLVNDRVWITDQILTRAELTTLFDLSTFYLCTSHGEGQNLPLIEAMGRGVVPVSVDNTAMQGYIRADNAVSIPSEERPFDQRLAGRYGIYGAKTFFTKNADIEAALNTASALSDEQYASKSAAALETVRDKFGIAPFSDAFYDLVARLSSSSEKA
jgi:tetratricopeptide (TPR) repeat protein